MGYVAIVSEGGLFPADLLDRIASGQAEGQRPEQFGLKGARLTDEIQGAFSDARSSWDDFKRRIAHSRGSLTTLTRKSWIEQLLKRLGFDLVTQRTIQIGSDSYQIAYQAGEAEAAPPVHVVAHDQPIDRRSNGSRRSPHALVQEYLNRSDALWGIVTNGARLRLLRNSARLARPTYLEFDLQGMVEGNLYSEFVLLYRILHRTRFPRSGADAHECLLERYYQQGIDEGGRVRERLREGVEAALRELGTGLLARPDSGELREALKGGGLSESGFYRELLRLVYRLLFLMVAEERRLIFPPANHDQAILNRQAVYNRYYSVSHLRDRCERYFAEDRHSDLWQGLLQTFRLLQDESAAQLGLSPLDGELFGPLACQHLAAAGCENACLLRAIYHLSSFTDGGVRRRVNYAGLDVEELGSVYESLLDYRPHVSLEGIPDFDLVAGSERKQTGSYYTPPELVRELIDHALVPVMEERLARVKSPEEKQRALLDLRVCDPASGSGHFLLAAARRIARELTKLRTGEDEPPPEAFRLAVRDVIRNCIYAVDRNPLAVDLCKVALWIEGHTAGLPLSFLDQHIKCGDSLVGVFDLEVLLKGIPDGAYAAVSGDDRSVATAYRRRNRQEREGQLPLGMAPGGGNTDKMAEEFQVLAELEERTPAEVRAKQELYESLRGSGGGWWERKVACDLWTYAFFAPLVPAKDGVNDMVPTTGTVRDYLLQPRAASAKMVGLAVAKSEERRFFHWPLEFPEVFVCGGFDCVLGNPPWERIKLQEQEFFASREPGIARAPNKAARQRLIESLTRTESGRALYAEFQEAKRSAECESKCVRGSRFPLTAVGDVNLYALFAELDRELLNSKGRAGIVVPTGIATDDSTKAFFQDVVDEAGLATLFDFENRKVFFPDVHASYKFCLLTLSAARVQRGDMAFFLTNTGQLRDERRRFQLSSEDFALLNPNTRTCPIFRTRIDAELTRAIYRRVPVLVNERTGESPWDVSFLAMFHMSNDSGLFHNEPGPGLVPLYEAKLFHQYNHRWATYENGDTRDATIAELSDPNWRVCPRYWVPEQEVKSRLGSRVPEVVWEAYRRGDEKLIAGSLALWFAGYCLNRGMKRFEEALVDRLFGRGYIDAMVLHGEAVRRMEREYPLIEEDMAKVRQCKTLRETACVLIESRRPRWLLAFRDITNTTNERTAIFSVIPRVGAGHKAPLVFAGICQTELMSVFIGLLNSLTVDYVARQKVGGTDLAFFTLRQLAVLPPSAFSHNDLASIVPRVLELTYTAWDLKPFAEDLGYNGPPFPWDEERRAVLRAELDAYYASLYGLTRDELRYILDPADIYGPDFPGETFRVLKEKEIRKYGEYRTRRLVLEAWDRLGLAPRNRDGRYTAT